MPIKTAFVALVAAIILAMTGSASGQNDGQRLDELEDQVSQLQSTSSDVTSVGVIVLLLFGAFCALWAQNTGRNAWLWFFLGLFLNVFAVVSLLIKNAGDRRAPNRRLFSEGRRIGEN